MPAERTYFILEQFGLRVGGAGALEPRRSGQSARLAATGLLLRPAQLGIQPRHLLLQALNPPVFDLQNAGQSGRTLVQFVLYLNLKPPVLIYVVIQLLGTMWRPSNEWRGAPFLGVSV